MLVLVIIMTCVLRFFELRYLMPKREAFAAVLHGEDADRDAMKVVNEEDIDGNLSHDAVAVNPVPA
jgi:hypothetical protein